MITLSLFSQLFALRLKYIVPQALILAILLVILFNQPRSIVTKSKDFITERVADDLLV
jgi:hypothetical protein